MSRHGNLPFHLYIKVNNKHLGDEMPDGHTEGIWHGVFGRINQTLSCHVLLESGAHWSGLPIQAISRNASKRPGGAMRGCCIRRWILKASRLRAARAITI